LRMVLTQEHLGEILVAQAVKVTFFGRDKRLKAIRA